MNEWARIETTVGDPVAVGELTLTPQARALIVRWPYGGYVWNWPLGLTVRRGNEIQQVAIANVTRSAMLGAAATAALLAVLLRALFAAAAQRGQR
jgi:hypothetical protein